MKKLFLSMSLFFIGVFVHAQGLENVEEVVVIGTKASLKSAIDKQRSSQKIISVIDSDALGDFPDTTAAEAVRRVSGISVENDQGEGRYVSIRGLSSDLNTVAINGATVTAPEGNRSVMLDGVPTELLDNIVISKSLTPDQDSDSIGGRIEFNTKNPSSLSKTLFKLKFDDSYNKNSGNVDSPKMALTYGGKISDVSAHVIGLTFASKHIVTYNNETGYGWETNSSGLKEMNDDWEMRYYDLTRERYGLTYDIDFIVNDKTTLYIKAFWNEYIDDELRFKDEYGKISQTGSTTEKFMETSRIRHDAESRVREEIRTIQTINFGGDTIIGDWNTSFQISHSFAEEDDSDNADVTFRCYLRAGKDEGCTNLKGIDSNTALGQFNYSNPQKPFLTVYQDYRELYQPENLNFKELELESSTIEDEEVAFKIDFEKASMYGDLPSTMKFGIKYRTRDVKNDTNKYFYEWDGKTLADFNPVSISWPFAYQTLGSFASAAATDKMKSQLSSMTLDSEETLVEDFTATEDVLALYAMTTIEAENALIIAGIRVEKTKFESSAYDSGATKTYGSNDYTFVSPNLTIKYFLSENQLLRGAIWRGLSRPKFGNAAPVAEVEIDGEDIKGSYGNPDLKPYEANNLDISYEYYGDELFFFSLGAFFKQIDNAIYPTYQKTATINGVNFNDGVKTYINAEQSDIKGVEITYQQEFNFLPSPFDGLYLAANMTYTDGESTFAFDDDQRFTTPFRKLSDQQKNISIGYDQGRVDARLSLSSRGDYLDWLADEEGDIDTISLGNSRFVDNHSQLDFSLKYDINDNLSVKLEGINLTDEPEYYFWGYKDRLSQYDEYGTTYSLGFRYNY
ncbi:MAG: TonB-dependent receptor [Proteobacteria bacterium]|nr:TonB-dependent receptor [Pseudomonadota bacterium]